MEWSSSLMGKEKNDGFVVWGDYQARHALIHINAIDS
jgi:hypothetical protein